MAEEDMETSQRPGGSAGARIAAYDTAHTPAGNYIGYLLVALYLPCVL
jgi:hypothetical protein